MIVTRMTRSRHYCALNFRGLTSFACLSLFKVFEFSELCSVFSRPVLHYEVFMVLLRFSATASLLYIRFRNLSTSYFDFFGLIFEQIVTF